MIWFTWRQFRVQTWVAIGGLAVLGIALAIAGRQAASAYTQLGLADCTTACDDLVSSFFDEMRRTFAGAAYDSAVAVMYVVPALIGAFWGAPLIARELETGTFRLAWSQSVTRTRWLVTKLALVGALSITTAGLLSLAVTWSGSTISHVQNDRISPLIFGAGGIVPIGYAAFAFALGAAAGLVIRRTVPAMAATLALYLAAVVVMPLWVRAWLAPISHTTKPLDITKIDGISMSRDGAQMRVESSESPVGAWVLTNETIEPSGQVFDGPANTEFCGRSASPRSCFEWIGSLNLRQDITYHTADQYWRLQWAETGLFIALALLLTGFCVWWVRRRLV